MPISPKRTRNAFVVRDLRNNGLIGRNNNLVGRDRAKVWRTMSGALRWIESRVPDVEWQHFVVEQQYDVRFVDGGSIVLVVPNNSATRHWMKENIETAVSWSFGAPVERRFLEGLLWGMACEGFNIPNVAT